MKGLIFTYLLTYGGALASLFNPYIGLLIYVCFAIIKPEDLWFWSVPQGNYSRTIAMALLVGWTLRGFGNWQFGRAGRVVGLLLAFWVWVVISSFLSAQPEMTQEFVESFTKVVLPFLVGMTLIDSVAKLKQLAWVIVLSHAYVAYDLNMAYYGGYNRLQDIGFGGMDNNCVAITMVTCTGLAFFLGFNAPRWWLQGIAFASVALMVHCVLFAFSRGGMLGLIITALITFVLIPKKPRHYLIFALTVVLAIRLAGPEVVERFSSTFADQKTRDASAQSRVDMWKTCAEIMIRSPIFGIGPRHFPLVAHLYGYTHNKEAHSLWMQVGAETGVVGLLLLVSFYGVCVLRLWPFTRDSQPVADPWFRDTARMVIASITGFAVSAQFVSLVGLEAPYYVVLLGAGALKLSWMPQVKAAAKPATWTYTPGLAPAAWPNVGR
jgi:probable O-glycosylation ligase (exosortase A-associated)